MATVEVTEQNFVETVSKGIVLLEPDVLLGIVAWPTLALS